MQKPKPKLAKIENKVYKAQARIEAARTGIWIPLRGRYQRIDMSKPEKRLELLEKARQGLMDALYDLEEEIARYDWAWDEYQEQRYQEQRMEQENA